LTASDGSSFPPDRRQDVDLHSLQHGVFPGLRILRDDEMI
jgi:hypothetical protein